MKNFKPTSKAKIVGSLQGRDDRNSAVSQHRKRASSKNNSFMKPQNNFKQKLFPSFSSRLWNLFDETIYSRLYRKMS